MSLLKKLMFWMMVVLIACRCGALAHILSTDPHRLPRAVYISAGIVVIYGLVLIFKSIVWRVYKKELAFFYGVAAAAVVFNLIFMRIFSRVEVGIIDFLVIGTVMDMLLDVVFVVLTLRESRYVRIKMGADNW